VIHFNLPGGTILARFPFQKWYINGTACQLIRGDMILSGKYDMIAVTKSNYATSTIQKIRGNDLK